MTATSFNPRRQMTIPQARRLARSLQTRADVDRQIADLAAREEAARLVDATDYDVGTGSLARAPARRSRRWVEPALCALALVAVAVWWVYFIVPR